MSTEPGIFILNYFFSTSTAHSHLSPFATPPLCGARLRPAGYAGHGWGSALPGLRATPDGEEASGFAQELRPTQKCVESESKQESVLHPNHDPNQTTIGLGLRRDED